MLKDVERRIKDLVYEFIAEQFKMNGDREQNNIHPDSEFDLRIESIIKSQEIESEIVKKISDSNGLMSDDQSFSYIVKLLTQDTIFKMCPCEHYRDVYDLINNTKSTFKNVKKRFKELNDFVGSVQKDVWDKMSDVIAEVNVVDDKNQTSIVDDLIKLIEFCRGDRGEGVTLQQWVKLPRWLRDEILMNSSFGKSHIFDSWDISLALDINHKSDD